MRKLPCYPKCFVCGSHNQAGTNVTFMATKKGIECEYTANQKHISYKGIVHGGVISALLDECIGWAVAIEMKAMCKTGELNVRFLRSVPINTTVIVKGFISADQVSGKKYRIGHGYIVDELGRKYAKAEGKFFPLSKEADKHILDLLEFKDNPGKKVAIEDLWNE